MKVLLVQTPTSHLGAGERVYPLGLARLAATLGRSAQTAALDMNLAPDPWPALKDRVETFRPEVVALSFRNLDPLAGQQTSYLSSLKTAARTVRQLAPDARILAGGPAFSLFGARLMAEIPQIDFGLVGEGEAVFPNLADRDIVPPEIPGLIWRREGRLEINPRAPGLPLDRLPAPDLAAFPIAPYLRGNRYVAAVGIEGKRGCSLRCGYCVYPSLGGTRLRLRSPGLIADDIEILAKEHGVGLFHFTDGVINLPSDHFEAVCRELLRRRLRVGWTGFFRETHLSADLLHLAVAAGLVAVYFSADALTGHGLKLLEKRMTPGDILAAARITADCGVLTMCHFLVNLPGELPRYRREALSLLDRLLEIHHRPGNLGAVIFNTARLYPDAPLTRRLLAEGMLDPTIDLLYPVYHNPAPTAHVLHELEGRCHAAGVFSRLALPFPGEAQSR